MSFRTLAAAAPFALVLAACSSAEDASDSDAAREDATASATANAAAGAAKTVEEENDLYSFSYAYPAAAGALPELAVHLDQDAEEAKATLVSESKDDQTQAEANDYPYRAHSFSKEWKVVADLPRYLSLSGEFATYSGGAHGMYGLESLVWDKQAKAGMDGVALFQSAEALDEALGQKLCDALDAERAKRRGEAVPADAGDDDTGFNSCQHVKDATVLVGSSGGGKFDRIGIWFGPYVAGPYAEGSYELNFPVDAAVIEAVKPEYREAFGAKE
ncbi:DUF4163 domain-containing protein [Pelagerythrobacter aerophilus]|uniref:DUF4163 domain-containing protein n=1 Tax=Pelagerythrobacter aerophilus TaxID=2306995 RepID=A0A418NHQ8_9SPHN|nr:DUF4163 domain-containing protein [Pelagerythrobacter aerophilus]RIV78045.1 DUF4163 domain-containing protein [Pelagerythrobacter aerophilus]